LPRRAAATTGDGDATTREPRLLLGILPFARSCIAAHSPKR
jgi:hypothetical protein